MCKGCLQPAESISIVNIALRHFSCRCNIGNVKIGYATFGDATYACANARDKLHHRRACDKYHYYQT